MASSTNYTTSLRTVSESEVINKNDAPFATVSEFIIAILLNVIGSFISALGFRSKINWIMTLCACMGSTLEVLSLNFASPSTISPLCSLLIFWSLLLDYKNLRKTEVLKAIVISIGITCCLTDVETGEESSLITNERTAWMVGLGFQFICMEFIYNANHSVKKRIVPLAYPGIIGGFTNVTLKLLINSLKQKQLLWCVVYSIITAIFGITQLTKNNELVIKHGDVHVLPVYVSTLISSIVIVNSFTFKERISVFFFIGDVIITTAILYL